MAEQNLNSMGAKPLVSISEVYAFYENQEILHRINLEIAKGEFVSIVGKSGSGKTTLLNCVAGFIQYTGEIQKPSQLSYIFQNRSLFPWMTVKKNILFGIEDKAREEKDRILNAVLDKVNLKGYEKSYPYQLSGGQAQRIAIARSLSYPGELVLADEPFNGLDTITKDGIIDWFLSLINNQKTFLFITHDLEDAIILSDRVLIINNKRLAGSVIIDIPRDERKELKASAKIIEYKAKINSLIYATEYAEN